ncbi:HAD family hydrolase [Rouxiella chamberiensis]|uniref:phosphoserine phosphatase n=1 Tax=Rouxiella chamberiensis TaxID=1513468 RepID=A0ABY7HR71_9GAMM|nr:HAD-IB family phosphatase [Rouxiella chamberiensis]WAT01889.1 HAD-IB family phosphatase [Rouxiella chamberiensis]
MDVIFDFDFTLLPEESTVEVLKLALAAEPDRDILMQRLADIAPKALAGKASFAENLFMLQMARRVRKAHVGEYVERNKSRLLPVFHGLFDDLRKADVNIHIISGGYEEWIKPLAAEWGISPDNVIGNRFVWWRNNVIGLRPSPLWSSKKSKTFIVDALRKKKKINSPALIIGDGTADRDVWSRGAVRWCIIAEYFNKESLEEGELCSRAATPEEMCQSVLRIVRERSESPVPVMN